MTTLATAMPKPLTILEAFCLSMVHRGFRTRYDLHRQGGISLGSSTPAIAKLIEAGLLSGRHHGSDGGRVRQDLRVTAQGIRELDHAWKVFLAERGGVTVEDALRVVDMAQHHGAKPDLIVGYLQASASQKAPGAKIGEQSETQAEGLGILKSRAAWTEALLRAEADFLARLADEIQPAVKKPRKAGSSRAV